MKHAGLFVAMLFAGCTAPRAHRPGPSVAPVVAAVSDAKQSVSVAQTQITSARAAAQRIDAKADVLLEHFRRGD